MAFRFCSIAVRLRRRSPSHAQQLLVADGVVAIAGGRNIANDYFMRQEGENFIDLDALVVGAVLPRLSLLFDAYWNSRHAWPVTTVAPVVQTPEVLRDTFVVATNPERAVEPETPEGPDRFGRSPPIEALEGGSSRGSGRAQRLFADTPDKILGAESPYDAEAPSDRDGIRNRLADRIRAVRQEVLVASPYIVPTRRAHGIPCLFCANTK